MGGCRETDGEMNKEINKEKIKKEEQIVRQKEIEMCSKKERDRRQNSPVRERGQE